MYAVGEMVARAAVRKAAVTPYHVKWFDETAWMNGTENGVTYVQKKYDGAHIQLSWKYGARGHHGGVPNELAINGLVFLEEYDEKFRDLLDFLRSNEEVVVTIELFGSRLTPGGYHRDWPKQFDFRVLDLYFLGRWLPPTRWMNVVPNPVHTEVVDNVDLETLKKWALSEDWYEGAVLKQYDYEFSQDQYYVGNGLRIAKFKPKELLSVPERFSRGRLKELFVEVKNELDKEPGETVDDIMNYLERAHPELLGKNRNKTMNIVAQIVKWYRFAR